MDEILEFLKLHHESFFRVHPYAHMTAQPTPEDSRAWSQILISLLTKRMGLGRGKGTDFTDGSDVKAANTWGAIDTPRFNGAIKAGTKSDKSGKMASLDSMPHLFLVLWDNEPTTTMERTRIWVVRPQDDEVFRAICEKWYTLRDEGKIISSNFQLHPPRNKNTNEIRNTCGNLIYPLLFEAIWNGNDYEIVRYDPSILINGQCIPF